MSTTRTADFDATLDGCRPADVTPVRIPADALESTAPEYLRDLKASLAGQGYQPASVDAEARFDDDCSLATQAEANRIRDLIRAAAFLGAGRVNLTVDATAASEKVEPAVDALAERANREGVRLDVTRE